MANRLFIGTDVLKISKPGFNAETETDLNNLIFHSNYPMLGLLLAGTVTVNANSTVVINFGVTLSILPFVYLELSDSLQPSYKRPSPVYIFNNIGANGAAFSRPSYQVTTSSFSIINTNTYLTTGSFTAKYFISCQGV